MPKATRRKVPVCAPDILIVNQTGLAVPRTRLADLWARLHRELISRDLLGANDSFKELCVAFVGSGRMQELNRDFRGKDRVTDVLSFSPLEDEQLGELVFCMERVREQARAQGWPQYMELSYLFIHGVLHLLGFDHETGEAQAEEMFALQDELFSLLVTPI